MTTRTISTWETHDNKGFAKVLYSDLEELFSIEYYDNEGHRFYIEDFPNKSLNYVEDAANNWSLGLRRLEENTI